MLEMRCDKVEDVSKDVYWCLRPIKDSTLEETALRQPNRKKRAPEHLVSEVKPGHVRPMLVTPRQHGPIFNPLILALQNIHEDSIAQPRVDDLKWDPKTQPGG